MTDNETLEAAYETVTAGEIAVIEAYEDALETYLSAVDALIADFPAPGSNPVKQLLLNAKMAGGNYQLANLKATYGLTPAPVMPSA